jgi:Na+/H+ antiporter NhaC
MVITGRELGPMLHAERRARTQGVGANLNPKFNEQQLHDAGAAELEQLEPLPETPRRWWNAVVPVLVTTLMVIITLIVTGVDECKRLGIAITSRNIFSESDSYGALLYGSVLGSISIWLLCLAQRVTPTGELRWFSRHRLDRPILSFSASLDYWIMGIRNLTGAILVLLLAWAVGSSFTICGTGLFLSSSLSDNVDPGALPFLTFAMSALLACIIGSSWGTMGIMFPLLLPAAHHAAPCNLDVFYGTTASILAGAVFGDHCSPISETTILTSVACRCDLPAHVKTQLPYAVIAGLVGMFIGNLPTGVSCGDGWAGVNEIMWRLARVAGNERDGFASRKGGGGVPL